MHAHSSGQDKREILKPREQTEFFDISRESWRTIITFCGYFTVNRWFDDSINIPVSGPSHIIYKGD